MSTHSVSAPSGAPPAAISETSALARAAPPGPCRRYAPSSRLETTAGCSGALQPPSRGTGDGGSGSSGRQPASRAAASAPSTSPAATCAVTSADRAHCEPRVPGSPRRAISLSTSRTPPTSPRAASTCSSGWYVCTSGDTPSRTALSMTARARTASPATPKQCASVLNVTRSGR
eukprot:350460-Chlamydomonas_euryale.AAC.4